MNSYPSKIIINWKDFIFYIIQKYWMNNDTMDRICSKCNIPMAVCIAHSGEYKYHFFGGCPNYPNCKELYNLNKDNFVFKKRSAGISSFGDSLCQCCLDSGAGIIFRTSENLLNEFIAIMYWMVSIDQEIYFVLVDNGVEG